MHPDILTMNPLIEVIFEIHYDSIVPEEALFGLLFPSLEAIFPHATITQLPILQIPQEIRKKDASF
ncbi:hypothetical protein ACXWOD_09920, partial [Streptococcus pyogenes]